MKRALAAAAVVMAAGCTFVDSTEHCVETRYGEVVNEAMSTGLNFTVMTDATCFSLTDQNFPDDGEVETIEAVTRSPNPVKITGDMAIVYAFDPSTVGEVFKAKRSEKAAEVEIYNAMREGYRNALSKWTVADVFSERRALIGDSVKMEIQRKLGQRAIIKQVFVRNLGLPPEIEAARTVAAQQAQRLDQARQQFVIDSTAALSKIITAKADAEAKQLLAQSYSTNASLKEIEVARELAKICTGVQTCILGTQVMDRMFQTAGVGK